MKQIFICFFPIDVGHGKVVGGRSSTAGCKLRLEHKHETPSARVVTEYITHSRTHSHTLTRTFLVQRVREREKER